MIEGSLKSEHWTDKEDNKQSRLKVRVSKFEVLYRAPKRKGEPYAETDNTRLADDENESTQHETVPAGDGGDIGFSEPNGDPPF